MSFSTIQAAPAPSAAPVRPPIPRWAAWLLLLPVFGVMIFSYGWPTARLVIDGLTSDRASAGWSFVFSAPMLDQFRNALSYGLLPVVLLVTVAPAFAWAASRSGLTNRWIARAALALPLAAYAPTGLALVWLGERRPESLVLTRWDGRLVMVATLGAFVVGAGAVCYLAALRRRARGDATMSAVLIVGSLLVLAAVAYALQQYTYVAMIENSVLNDQLGVGGSPMAVLKTSGGDPARYPVAVSLLLLLALLGVTATIIVLRSRLVLEYDPTRSGADDEGRPSRMAIAATMVGILVLALFTITQLGPWLVSLTAGVSEDNVAMDRFGGPAAIFNATWLIPLGTALVQVSAAVLGAFAIAIGRPLGRHSEWLLLAFTPWLFVGNGLMELPRLDANPIAGQPLFAYGPVSWLSVPALLLFTIFFRGQAAPWLRARSIGAPRSWWRSMSPIVPMAGFTVGVLWLVQAQDLIVATLADSGDGIVANAQLIISRVVLAEPQPALGYPLQLLLFFSIGGLILQWTYLDRVAIRVGPSPSTHDSH